MLQLAAHLRHDPRISHGAATRDVGAIAHLVWRKVAALRRSARTACAAASCALSSTYTWTMQLGGSAIVRGVFFGWVLCCLHVHQLLVVGGAAAMQQESYAAVSTQEQHLPVRGTALCLPTFSVAVQLQGPVAGRPGPASFLAASSTTVFLVHCLHVQPVKQWFARAH